MCEDQNNCLLCKIFLFDAIDVSIFVQIYNPPNYTQGRIQDVFIGGSNL